MEKKIMPRTKYTHLHKYKKVKRGSQVVFKCMLPGCRHFYEFSLAENALCACNRCGEAMVLTKAKMELVRPHCDACTRVRDSKKAQTIDALVELFKDAT